MSVPTFIQPNVTSQAPEVYKAAIDAAIAVMARTAAGFAPHEQATPDLSIAIDAGIIPGQGKLPVEVAAQSTAALTAPTGNPRRDIVYIDAATGAVGVATGAEASVPVDPEIPGGKVAIARIRLAVDATAIANADLDDLRSPQPVPLPGFSIDSPTDAFPWSFFTVKDASDAWVGDGNGPNVRIDFANGDTAISAGDTVTGGTSGAYGQAEVDATLESGSYGGGDAAGYIVLRGVTGTFVDTEDLEVSAAKVAEAASGPSAVYSIDWMNGTWVGAGGFYWDPVNQIISRREGAEDIDYILTQYATKRFPDHIGPRKSGKVDWRIQKRSSQAAASNVLGGGLPDRIVWPIAGSVGGCEIGDYTTSEGLKVWGANRLEIDGFGAAHGYLILVNQTLSDDGSTRVVFEGFAFNDSDGPSNYSSHPSFRWGIRSTLDLTGGAPYTTTRTEYVEQYAVPTAGTIAYVDVRAIDFGAGPRTGLLHIQDQKSSGTEGGTFTSGSWQTRVLNTALTNEIPDAGLASNQITLPAGTYEVDAWAVAYNVSSHVLKLYDTTGAADLLVGKVQFSGSPSNVSDTASVRGRITLAVESVLELRHRCSATVATSGLGKAATFGVVEVYADIQIRRVA